MVAAEAMGEEEVVRALRGAGMVGVEGMVAGMAASGEGGGGWGAAGLLVVGAGRS